MKLTKIKGKTYIWNKPVCIGVYFLDDKSTIIIDSGLDSSYSKKIIRYFEENNLELKAIINTHSHADHCGGNRYLQERTGCEIFSSRFEGSIINNPELEPIYLYGASPIKKLKNKFLQAERSDVTNVIESNTFNICESKFEAIDLFGHSPGMIGITTEDNVTFIGDSLFDRKTIEKHRMLYCMDLEKQFETLDKLKNLDSEIYISSHGGVISDLEILIEENRRAYENINSQILNILEKPKTLEEILSILTNKLELKLNIGMYYLNKSVLSCHISYLSNNGFIKPIINENKLYWEK